MFDFVMVIVVFIFGIVLGFHSKSYEVKDGDVMAAYAACVPNEGVRSIKFYNEITVTCNNGAMFNTKKE
jgi:hypothetical protein